jgi:endonuclease G
VAQSTQDLTGQYLEKFARNKKGGLEKLIQAAQPGTESPGPPSDAQRSAQDGVRSLQNNRTPSPDQMAGLEAIILPKIRPVLDVVDNDFHTEHPLWQKLNDDQAVRQRLQTAAQSIGRLELPGSSIPYGGTGFVVGSNLIMTNRHVAAIFAAGIGTRHVSFKPGNRAGIDLKRELDRPTGPTLAVKRIVMIHPYWDMALLEVEGLPASAKPLPLSQDDPTGAAMSEVAAIGYPAFDTRNDADVQNDLFRKVFGVKRLQPGTMGGRQSTESFGKMVSALRHNCSTLGGNSGSALVDLNTGQVLGLHFGGRYEVINFAVPCRELARDGRIVDAGVTFGTAAPGGTPPWSDWWRDADEETITDRSSSAGRSLQRPLAGGATAVRGVTQMADGSIQFSVPLTITIRLGDGAPQLNLVSSSDGVTQAGTEAMVMPFHDEDYDSREGYDPDFLDTDGTGISVPLPAPATAADVAKTKDGGDLLHYQNFSVAMHATRRLALFTASNVTAAAKLKKPEPGKNYTRKGLSGLADGDVERWFPDPRLADEFQLPDVFYTRDDGAFDKGHIVRREDVAWGTSYDLLRMANGDTYHLTNCSPQVKGFNQSSQGVDNWGDLEDHVLKGAASERYCQFAGPVLDPNDEVFVGRAGGTKRVKVRIPSRYWKVLVVRTEEGLASFGFVQEQDLSDVPFEEFVPAQFKRMMVSLTDLQELTGVTFPSIVVDADQFETNEGIELAFHAGVGRAGAKTVSEEGVIL